MSIKSHGMVVLMQIVCQDTQLDITNKFCLAHLPLKCQDAPIHEVWLWSLGGQVVILTGV